MIENKKKLEKNTKTRTNKLWSYLMAEWLLGGPGEDFLWRGSVRASIFKKKKLLKKFVIDLEFDAVHVKHF